MKALRLINLTQQYDHSIKERSLSKNGYETGKNLTPPQKKKHVYLTIKSLYHSSFNLCTIDKSSYNTLYPKFFLLTFTSSHQWP